MGSSAARSYNAIFHGFALLKANLFDKPHNVMQDKPRDCCAKCA